MRKFTIVTGHGKLDFIEKADGRLELISVDNRLLSKNKVGKLGKEMEKPMGERDAV